MQQLRCPVGTDVTQEVDAPNSRFARRAIAPRNRPEEGPYFGGRMALGLIIFTYFSGSFANSQRHFFSQSWTS